MLGAVAVLGGALGFSPVSSAEDRSLWPPGTSGPVGPGTEVGDTVPTLFWYQRATYPYDVLDDDGNATGHFDATITQFVAPYGALLPFFSIFKEVISDGTGSAAAAVGSIHEGFALITPLIIGLPVIKIIGNDYWSTPDGTADYVTLFNYTFPLFDTFAATDTDLTDLALPPDLGISF